MSLNKGFAGLIAWALLCGTAHAQDWQQERAVNAPMSAIDWLSTSVVMSAPSPYTTPGANLGAVPGEAPVSHGAGVEPVSVTALDLPNIAALGLLSTAKTGLPRGLWGNTPEVDLARLLRKERVDTLPAIQSLLVTLLLAELDPPRFASPDQGNTLFLARIDRLLDLGALEPAFALLQQAGSNNPERFRRLFDVALLLGQEDKACESLRETPNVSPSFPARIFCLARAGDWPAAALSFATARSLGQIDPAMDPLLERFLDPEFAEDSNDLPAPLHPTPLVFRMMEAIGQPLPTTTLPVAFSQADLRANTGWKTRIEAAERLAKMGAIDPNQLLGLYTETAAAASGGVWDRVSAMAALDAAIAAGSAKTVSAALPRAFAAMEAVELEAQLAALYAKPLAQIPLSGTPARIAFRLGLLSEEYEPIARARTPQDADEALLIGVAKGSTTGLAATDTLGIALKAVFDAPPAAPEAYADLLPADRLGEALLRAIDDVTEGAKGDYRRVTAGLSLLRHVGLESTARRAALELVVLERRG
ncbi:hypothetical protein [Phaeovulum sp.]|uniref:hypothetical protein n=1 Tax=Phaeovulum sp. TaxID=2934796 RepID=UPI0039E6E0A3